MIVWVLEQMKVVVIQRGFRPAIRRGTLNSLRKAVLSFHTAFFIRSIPDWSSVEQGQDVGPSLSLVAL